MKLKKLHTILSGLFLVLMMTTLSHAVYLWPPTWDLMTMLDIDYGYPVAGKLSITTTAVVPKLFVPRYTPAAAASWYGDPSIAYNPGAPYEATKPWSVLNGRISSREYGWNPASDVLGAVKAAYGGVTPDPGVWIERISQSPGLETYLAVGWCGVNGDDSCTVDPANPTGVPYSGIFGTGGSSSKWRWDGYMDHNAYAVPFGSVTTPNQPFSATYRIYVGDAAGNDIDPAAATTTTWTWKGPNQVIGPISFSPAVLSVGGTVTVSATATSGLPVTFSSLTPSVCSVSGATVSGLANGACMISADQAGNATYDSAPQVLGTMAAALPPAITGFTPTTGTVGTAVTIAGKNLAGATAVTFNGTAAAFTVVSAAKITTTVPIGAAAGKITVTTPGGSVTSAGTFTVTVAKPTATSFSPTSGIVGDRVTITGTNLTGATSVTFNGIAATTLDVVSATRITATVPVGATTGKLSVTTPGGVATTVAGFTIIMPPAITSFTPATGLPGSRVTISGTNLANAKAVTVSGVPAVIVSTTAAAVVATIPVGASVGPITVSTVAGTGISATSFTVPGPAITGFTPAAGGGVGTGVTIIGTNFTGATAVRFHNGMAAPFVVVSATSIATAVPSGAITGPISVFTPAGSASSVSNFTVSAAKAVPKVAGFTPATGGVGTAVTITGSNLVGASAVKFNGTPVTTYTVVSGSSIVTALPPGATTGTLSVTTATGSGTSSAIFTVAAGSVAPVVISFAPASGRAGTEITVTGANLGGVTAVKIGTSAARFRVKSATALVVTAPAGAATGVLSVTTDGGTVSSASTFTGIP